MRPNRFSRRLALGVLLLGLSSSLFALSSPRIWNASRSAISHSLLHSRFTLTGSAIRVEPLASTTYYSKSTKTNFSTLTDWGTNTDGSGSNPAAITNADDFVVTNGANVTTLGGSVSVQNLTIDSGAALTLDSTNTITATAASNGVISVSGTLNVNGSVTSQINANTLTITSTGVVSNNTTVSSGQPIAVTTFNINNGGTYNHNVARSANIGTTKNFGNTSNFVYTSATGFQSSPTYGNLRWNGSSSLTVNAASVTVNGSLRISNGTFNQQSSSNGTITIGGGLLIDGGAFVSSSGAGVGSIVFANAGVASGDLQISSGSASFQNITVNSGRTVGLLSSISIPASRTFTNNGTFNCATNAVSGAGNFTTSSTATLGIGSADGIDSGSTIGNIRVTGTRTFDSATSYTYNGSVNQATGNGLSATVKNFTIANTGSGGSNTVTLGSTISVVGGDLSITNGIFDLGSNTVDRSASGGTLTVSNGATLKIGSTNTLPSNYATHSIGATSTIEYSGSSQNIAALNSSQSYGHLTLSGSGTKTLPSGTTGIAGTLTINGVTLDATTNSTTVNFNGSGTQNINSTSTSQTFVNVTVSGSSTVSATGSLITLNLNGAMTLTSGTLSAPATINISGTWTNNGGSFTPNSGTVVFNSTSADQNINGSASSQSFNAITVSKSGRTLTVGGSTTSLSLTGLFAIAAGTFNIGTATSISTSGSWTQTSGTTFTPGSGTVTFTGSSASTIGGTATAQTFNNLTVNKTSQDVSITGSTTTFTLNGNLSIGSGSFTTGTATTMNVGGNWTNNSTFVGTGTTVVFNGSSAQTIIGSSSTAFASLTISTSAGVNLNKSGSVSTTLTLNNDLTTDAQNGVVLTATGSTSATTSGSGDVIGYVRRSDVGLTTRAFGNSDVRITNTNVTSMDLTVLLVKTHPPNFNSVNRTYTLTVNSGTVIAATLRLHYRDSELNSNTATNLDLYRYNGTAWADNGTLGLTRVTGSEPHNYIEQTPITTFSSWTLANGGQSPTAVKLASFNATEFDNQVMLRWQTGYEVSNLGFNIYREQNGARTLVNPSLIAGSALMVGRETQMTAGFSYVWYDHVGDGGQESGDGEKSITYWLEDVDLDGTSTMHGPVAVVMGKGRTPKDEGKSPTLNELGSQESGDASQGILISGWPAAQREGVGVRVKGSESRSQESGVRSQQAAQQTIAATAGVKIAVSKTGWYRVTQPELIAAGYDANANAAQLHLFANGQELPIKVSGGGAVLGPSDYIEFYGRGSGAVTDARQTYYLVSGDSAGQRIGNIGAPNSAGTSAGPASFDYTVERKDRTTYFANLLNGDAENIFGMIVRDVAKSETISLSHVDTAGLQAQVEISMVGVTLQPHHVQVTLNGTPIGSIDYNSKEHPVKTFLVPATLIREGDNTMQFVAASGQDTNLVDYVRITYPHTYIADNDALSISVSSGATTKVAGFTSANVRVIDVTDQNAIQEIAPVMTAQSDGTFTADLQVPNASTPQPHVIYIFADAQAAHADLIKRNEPSTWAANTNRADYLIITAHDFIASAQTLAQYRQAQGMTAEVVDVEDLFDEFSFGLHTPTALHDFLFTTQTSWAQKPRFIALMGDSSYDPNNYFGAGFTDYVPTKLIDTVQMETASDDWLADFNGDGVADLAIGRLPVRTAADANVMVNKILSYEAAPFDPARGAVLVADNSFERSSNAVASTLPSSMPRQVINRSGGSDSSIHNQIVDAINQGPRVVNYVGHGSNGVWTGALLLSNLDAPNLTNSTRLSLFTSMTCLNGYFENAFNDSLAEALLRAPKGGAVAVWASTGMTEPSFQSTIDQTFYQQLFSPSAPPIGDVVRAAKLSTDDPDVRRTWTLFGDPAMSMFGQVAPADSKSTISGTIADSNGQPLAGVTVSLSGKQSRETITDANGNYAFADADTNGFYNVTPGRASYSFSPGSRSFTLNGVHTSESFVGTVQGVVLNPLDADAFFVRQHYLDFLNREPDEAGFNFWLNGIASCGSDDRCREVKRINTSAAYFLSIEFQETGFEVYRMYKAAFGDLPNAPVPLRFAEFTSDTHDIANGVIVGRANWQATLDANKAAFAQQFVQRSRFAAQYATSTSPTDFVNSLFMHTGVTPSADERTAAVNEFAGATDSSDANARARALRRVAENPRLSQQEFNRAFVLMQYFGYLRRDPNSAPDADFSGYNFWLNKLNSFKGNYIDAEMVKAFISSPEYRRRFGN